MDIRKLQRAIVDGLEDVKAQGIVVFNTEHLSSMFERVIIASGASNRQTRALASSVRVAVKSAGLQVLRTEGEDNGEWIIVDCGAAVVHVMQPAIREYYHLEEIWGGKAVNMKMGSTSTGLVKASEPDAPPKRRVAPRPAAAEREAEMPAPRAAVRSAEARKGAAPPPPARAPAKASARPATKAAARPAAKAAPVRFKAGAAKAPAAANASSKAAAKGAAKPAAKPAARIKTLVVGKPAVNKTAAKKTATKASPARKAAPARKGGVARKGPLTKVASRR